MKRFLTATGMYLIKTFRGVRFWCAIALYIGLLALISQDLISEYSDVAYILHYAFANSTSYFLLIICALPGSAVFAEEWSAKRFVSIYSRTKRASFSSGMIVSSFLSALIVSLSASFLYMAILSFKYPVCGDPSDIGYLQQMSSYANGGLAASGNYLLYYFMEFITQGCLMGLFSAFATLLSIKLTDSNIAVVMPMILYITVTNIMSYLPVPKLLNPYHVYSQSGTVYRTLFPDSTDGFSVVSMLYPLIYTVVILFLFTVIAHFMIIQKYEKYNDIG